MTALNQALKLSLLFLLMQCILSESVLEQSKQPLEKLNDIVTKRIHSTLKEHQDSPTKSQDEEFQRQFQRLSLAAALPLDKLDEKIRAYHAYRNYGEQKQSNSNADQSLIRQANESENYDAFEKRVINLLEKLGVYDRYTERVFRAIFSDDKLLKALKKRLDELDKDKDDSNKNKNKNKDKDFDCCLWDFIHSLF